MRRAALISPDRLYRYWLTRQWGDDAGYWVAFVGLNPSTADAEQDDPTIRRCISFAKTWGYDGMMMVNLFAYRATDLKSLCWVEDPIGPDNETHLKYALLQSHKVVAAWGASGPESSTFRQSQRFMFEAGHAGVTVECFGKTSSGHPKHPLYLKATTPLEAF